MTAVIRFSCLHRRSTWSLGKKRVYFLFRGRKRLFLFVCFCNGSYPIQKYAHSRSFKVSAFKVCCITFQHQSLQYCLLVGCPFISLQLQIPWKLYRKMQKNNTGHYSRLAVVVDFTTADVQEMTELWYPSEAALMKYHEQNSQTQLTCNCDKS